MIASAAVLVLGVATVLTAQAVGANAGKSGFQGAPVGMTRIFQVGDGSRVPADYFEPPAA